MHQRTPQTGKADWRSAAAVISASLLLALAGCNLWRRPAQPPAKPPEPSNQPNTPAAPSSEPEQQRNEAEARAADLFNRGENDLACEQVQRALELQGSSPINDQLARFQQACMSD